MKGSERAASTFTIFTVITMSSTTDNTTGNAVTTAITNSNDGKTPFIEPF